ncbi:hypothetical protein LX32DRAFT_321665 [Colletotrichum zoysiae]|uniref:Uncharacterized protein n=1 Tax=Colletotrichum zoysiae TaxID=1216348 RepID=A0AAD9HKD3_9PEZI|nr:hypothetical protein LX32DRAFT_321665 [Colletotrichum zoysiae]
MSSVFSVEGSQLDMYDVQVQVPIGERRMTGKWMESGSGQGKRERRGGEGRGGEGDGPGREGTARSGSGGGAPWCWAGMGRCDTATQQEQGRW